MQVLRRYLFSTFAKPSGIFSVHIRLIRLLKKGIYTIDFHIESDYFYISIKHPINENQNCNL